MIAKRIIPCLDVRNGRVVKGVNFEGVRDVADPVEMARMYNAAGADELVFYDITASYEGRALFTDILTQVASEIFIPLTVGGGINTLEDFDRVLKCGADKVSVNSGALRDPGLIPAAAKRYGSQCVVLSADVKRVDGQFRVFAKGGPGGHRPGRFGVDRPVRGQRRGGDLPEQHRHRRGAGRLRPRDAGRGGRACQRAHHRLGRRGQKGGFPRAVPPQRDRRGAGGGHFPPETARHPRLEGISCKKWCGNAPLTPCISGRNKINC